MESREELEQKIKTWDGVNKYIVKDAKRKLAELDKPKVVEKPKAKEKEVKPTFAEKAGDLIEDLLDDGQLNKSNKKKRVKRK